MAALTSLAQISEAVRARGTTVRVAIAACAEPNAIRAGLQAHREGLAEPIFVGDLERMRTDPDLRALDISRFDSVHEPDPAQAVQACLGLVRAGRAEFLMKGSVKTDVLLRAVLSRSSGFAIQGLFSHVGVFEHPREERLLLVTDAAVNIDPSLSRKIDIINNAVCVAHKLGMEQPLVAVLSATERVAYQAMPSTKDADILSKLCRMGVFGNAIVGGPFALDIAVSAKKAATKGVHHPVAGRADILCAPHIVAANVLYKSVTSLMEQPMAGVVVGAPFPLVLPSRGDSDESKFYALALASYLSGQCELMGRG